MMHMEPVVTPLMTDEALGLGDLVGVMGEGVVHAAAVDIEGAIISSVVPQADNQSSSAGGVRGTVGVGVDVGVGVGVDVDVGVGVLVGVGASVAVGAAVGAEVGDGISVGD